MNSDDPNASPEPISYRRVDPTPTQWRPVGSFTIAKWHAAKAVLERNGVLCRMAANPDDDESLLLVPSTDVFWAAELIRQAGEPKKEIERALGFEVVSGRPPPLPDWAITDAPAPVLPVPADAEPVLNFDATIKPEPTAPQYGCALAVLWTLLAVAAAVTILLVVTYG